MLMITRTLLACCTAAACSMVCAENIPKPGFPPFKFTTQNGASETAGANRGKVVVLNFWFTTYHPCVAEIADLNQLVKEYEGKNVSFIAPTFDDRDTVADFLKKHPFSYRIVGFGDDDLHMYFKGKTMAFPTHVILDKNGRLIYRAISEADLPAMRKAIDGAL